MLRRARAAALLAAGAALVGAAPALAAPPSGGITGPDEGAVLREQPAMTASYVMRSGEIIEVRMDLRSERSGAVVDFVEPGNGRSSVAVRWEPVLAYNGRYELGAQATGREAPAALNRDETTPRTVRTFSVALPPAPPVGVEVSAAASGAPPAVRWDENVEPDLVGYQVERAPAGSDEFVAVGITTRPRFADTSVPGPGRYRYRVRAVRQGATDAADDGVASEPSQPSRTVEVTAPPTTTTQPAAAGGGGTSGSTGGSPTPSSQPSRRPPVAARSGGGVDLSAFRRLQAAGATPSGALPAPADTGYQETLPFALPVDDTPAEQATPDTSAGRMEVTAAPVTATGGEDERAQSLQFIAGGLLAFVLLMGTLLLRAEVNRHPPDDLPAEAV